MAVLLTICKQRFNNWNYAVSLTFYPKHTYILFRLSSVLEDRLGDAELFASQQTWAKHTLLTEIHGNNEPLIQSIISSVEQVATLPTKTKLDKLLNFTLAPSAQMTGNEEKKVTY